MFTTVVPSGGRDLEKVFDILLRDKGTGVRSYLGLNIKRRLKGYTGKKNLTDKNNRGIVGV